MAIPGDVWLRKFFPLLNGKVFRQDLFASFFVRPAAFPRSVGVSPSLSPISTVQNVLFVLLRLCFVG